MSPRPLPASDLKGKDARSLQTGVSGFATFILPEPPTINTMLEWARKKTHIGPTGKYMRKAQSVYWVEQQKYFDAVQMTMLGVGGTAFGRRMALREWHLASAHFRLHQLRDEVELMSALKWPVDALVKHRIVEDDSPRHLVPFSVHPPKVTQEVSRSDRGLTLTIALPDVVLSTDVFQWNP